ncbi:MAG: hypothetical protein QF685_12390 [Verrucomicrobiota bacterium]|nr:hypothetical protein [Verrucomicrobiota bacterium]
MKKWIDIMAALIVTFVLAGSVAGCGQAVPDQGEADTTDNSEADEKGEGEANPKGGGKGSGDDDPSGGTGGAGDPDNVNP